MFFYIPIQKTKPISEADINALTLGQLFALREACSHANSIEGFQIESKTDKKKLHKAPPVKAKTLEEFRQFLHTKQGFNKVIHD